MPLVRGGREIGGALVGNVRDTHGLRALFEDQNSAIWAGEALADLLRFCSRRQRDALRGCRTAAAVKGGRASPVPDFLSRRCV
jgi:hypothetical protein